MHEPHRVTVTLCPPEAAKELPRLFVLDELDLLGEHSEVFGDVAGPLTLGRGVRPPPVGRADVVACLRKDRTGAAVGSPFAHAACMIHVEMCEDDVGDGVALDAERAQRSGESTVGAARARIGRCPWRPSCRRSLRPRGSSAGHRAIAPNAGAAWSDGADRAPPKAPT